MRGLLLLPSVAALALAAPLVGSVPGHAAPPPEAPVRADEPPNIVVITTDDQTREDLAWMPLTTSLLADQGVEFTEAITPNPVCGPSRATLLTGQYSHNTGIHGNDSEQDLLDRTRTLPVWLDTNGYQTGFTGKYVNRYRPTDEGEPGWDSFSAMTKGSHYFGYTMSNNGDPVTYTDVHADDTVAAQTRALIQEYAGDAPFFIWASYPAPHGVCEPQLPCDDAPIPATRHASLYPDVVAPQLAKPSFNEADVSDKPRKIKRLHPVDPADVQHDFTERIRTLASADEGVADTIAALDETGELDNTIVVFTSDNGFQLGEHRHAGKVFGYEESLGVPLLMRGPGIPAGVDLDQTVTMADVAPTLAAAAGAPPNAVVDGRDLWPYLTTGELRPFTAVVETGIARNNWTYRGVRTERYTFLRWGNGQAELYDRRRDPYELDNAAGTRRYAGVERALSRRLTTLADCVSTSACSRVFRGLPNP
jgi:N-acetylglucosamine-6-sulfatase